MMSGLEWILFFGTSAVVMLVMVLVMFWIDIGRTTQQRAMSDLGESLGMLYRVLGRDYLDLPQLFMLDERPGSVASHSVIERSLVSARARGLPAVFEYVSYRDRLGLRRAGSPFLVLAARVPAGAPPFTFKPLGLRKKLAELGRGLRATQTQSSPGAVSLVYLPDLEQWGSVDMGEIERLRRAGLWIQVCERAVYVAQPFHPWWHGSGLSPVEVERLVGLALPVLKALKSPDVGCLEKLMRPRNLSRHALREEPWGDQHRA
jgi:hypothetical protein